MPYTCECGQKLDIIAALDAVPSDQMGSSGMFVPVCGGCGNKALEIRLRNNGFDVGYSYFGGSMHYEAMQRVSVKGLKITPSDPDDLDVVIGSRHWHFGIRHISTQRQCVFPQAYAAGKRVDDLDFNQWGVTLTGLERNRTPLEYSGETVIMAEDFLHLTGPSPYLTRAWHYINGGKSKSNHAIH